MVAASETKANIDLQLFNNGLNHLLMAKEYLTMAVHHHKTYHGDP